MSAVDRNRIIGELEEMKRRMDDLYSESIRCREGDRTVSKEESETIWKPAMDILESENEWLLVADLPGVNDEELKVEVFESQLTISGYRNVPHEGKVMNVSQKERPDGRFSRTFILPLDAAQGAIQAHCKQGVLTVTVPKERHSEAVHRRVVVHSR